MSNNKDFKIKNAIKPTVYQEKLGTVTIADPTAPQSISTWSYDNVQFFAGARDGFCTGFEFNDDGTKLYIIGSNNDRVYEHTLSTAYDISAVSYNSSDFFSVSSQETNPFAVRFNNNGTKMYIIGDLNTKSVFQYSLSTAWTVNTASYDNVSFDTTTIADVRRPTDLLFKPDGTKMYIVCTTQDTIHQYSLSTAYDISTASYDNVSVLFSSQNSRLYSFAFNNDGTKMYTADDGSNSLYQYSLSTAYDISTASYDNLNFSVNSQASLPFSIAFNNNLSKVYVLNNSNDRLYQYSTVPNTKNVTLDLSTGAVFDVTLTADSELFFTNPADSGTVSQATVLLKSSGNYSVSYDSSIEFMGGSAPDTPATNEADVLTFSTRDGGTSYQASHIIDGAA
jgi:hypothetical protein